MTKNKDTNWDSSSAWYNDQVGEKGHFYHKTVIIEKALQLLILKKGESLLDLGCGQGVLQRHLPKDVQYTGIDNSKNLIQEATKMSKGRFLVSDVCKHLPLEGELFDAVCFMLSLQNMEFPENAISHASKHIKTNGRILIILNHPCFRIPRQSGWGIDEQAKLQYRRENLYMSPQKIPIQTNPSKGNNSPLTYSFHFPLSFFVSVLTKNGFLISTLEEWCSDKKSEGSRAKMENRARGEFPLFLAILASKNREK